MVDAGPDGKRDRAVSGAKQGPVILTAQIAGKGAARWGAVVPGIFAGANGGSNRHKLDQLLAPGVAGHFQTDAHDAIRTQGIGLLLHTRDRQFPRVVHRLGHGFQFHALVQRPLLPADMIDARSHDQAQWLEAGFADKQELIDRKIAGENALLCGRPA